jgi:hypothetical protein
MTQTVSANVFVPDKMRCPLSKEKQEAQARASKNGQFRRAIRCNTKSSRIRCDSRLKSFA